jgi:hypothetical protein
LNHWEVQHLYNWGHGRSNWVYTQFGIAGTPVTTPEGTNRILKMANATPGVVALTAALGAGTVVLQQPGGVWSSALTESVASRVKLSNRLKGLVVKLSLSSAAGKRTRFQLIKLFFRIFPKSL